MLLYAKQRTPNCLLSLLLRSLNWNKQNDKYHENDSENNNNDQVDQIDQIDQLKSPPITVIVTGTSPATLHSLEDPKNDPSSTENDPSDLGRFRSSSNDEESSDRKDEKKSWRFQPKNRIFLPPKSLSWQQINCDQFDETLGNELEAKSPRGLGSSLPLSPRSRMNTSNNDSANMNHDNANLPPLSPRTRTNTLNSPITSGTNSSSSSSINSNTNNNITSTPNPPKSVYLDESDDDNEEVDKPLKNEQNEEEISALGDWNQRFQSIVTQVALFQPNTPLAEKISANLALIGLAQDFLYSATSYGKIIISEVFLPDHQKTIKPVEIGLFFLWDISMLFLFVKSKCESIFIIIIIE